MAEKTKNLEISLEDPNEAVALFGISDSNLKTLEEEFQVSLVTRGETILISGKEQDVELVHNILRQLLNVMRKGIHISQRDVVYAVQMAKQGTIDYFDGLYDKEIAKNAKGKSIRVKTIGQQHYVSAIRKNDLVFGIGPAGTGKTFLAVVMAVHALKNGFVKRIILTRPAVEAGESLGFLPGDLKEKVDPYLRPLYDALHDVLGVEHTQRLIER
ncbi:MAG: PhoH family protein, partial [Bacillales bacterium]|nr:PhoH family protein [Bacillales bacterium]